MKRLIRSLKFCGLIVAASGSLVAVAQNNSNLELFGGGRFRVNQPASAAGVKQITTSIANGWGGAITTPIVNAPVAKALGPDSLVCSTVTNASNISGKFAILYRGTCNFSAKALAVQQAGAVGCIIINNIPGPPVGMGAGTSSTSVTIPVIMVSDVTGQAMMNAINSGSAVTITIGQWSLGLAADIGMVPYSAAMPPARVIPASQLVSTNGDPAAYRLYTAGLFSNFGTGTQNNIKLKQTVSWTPNGSTTSSVVYTDSATLASLTPTDSTDIASSPRFYNPHATGKGRFDMVTMLSSATGDSDTSDNRVTDYIVVSDSTYCRGSYDFTTNRPTAQTSIRPGTGSSFSFGPLFYVAKGDNKIPRTAQFTLSAGAGLSLDGKTANAALFKWSDGTAGNPADGVMQEGELALKAVGQKNFTSSDSGFFDYKIALTSPTIGAPVGVLEDNSYYWLAVGTDGTVFVGVDDQTNSFARSFASEKVSSRTDYTGPVYPGDLFNIASLPGESFRMFPFRASSNDPDSIWVDQRGLVPAMALQVASPSNVSVKATEFAKSLSIFPNPAANEINVSWIGTTSTGKINVTLMNGLGQTVIMRSYAAASGQQTAKIQLGNLPAGNYWVVFGTDEGIDTRTLSIAR